MIQVVVVLMHVVFVVAFVSYEIVVILESAARHNNDWNNGKET